MGAWDATPFGNDEASDFFIDLEDSDDVIAALRDALDEAADAEDHLEAPAGSTAVAAAAVVAERVGGPLLSLGDERRQRIAGLSFGGDATQLVSLARRALDRVEANDSELLELWDEADEGDAFRQTLADMRASLPA